MSGISTNRRTYRRLRWIGDGIVDLIASIAHVSKNGVRLFNQVDLEPDVIHDVCAFPRNGYDSDKVDERYSALSIVDEGCLTFLTGVEHTLEMGDSYVVGVLSLGAFDNLAIRC
jgi:hypothetical protein